MDVLSLKWQPLGQSHQSYQNFVLKKPKKLKNTEYYFYFYFFLVKTMFERQEYLCLFVYTCRIYHRYNQVYYSQIQHKYTFAYFYIYLLLVKHHLVRCENLWYIIWIKFTWRCVLFFYVSLMMFWGNRGH